MRDAGIFCRSSEKPRRRGARRQPQQQAPACQTPRPQSRLASKSSPKSRLGESLGWETRQRGGKHTRSSRSRPSTHDFVSQFLRRDSTSLGTFCVVEVGADEPNLCASGSKDNSRSRSYTRRSTHLNAKPEPSTLLVRRSRRRGIEGGRSRMWAGSLLVVLVLVVRIGHLEATRQARSWATGPCILL
jgi:hypothetical protein